MPARGELGINIAFCIRFSAISFVAKSVLLAVFFETLEALAGCRVLTVEDDDDCGTDIATSSLVAVELTVVCVFYTKVLFPVPEAAAAAAAAAR